MVETDFGGDFVSLDSTKDGDIATIITEGQFGELEYKGKTKRVLNIDVEINGKKMVWTPGLRAGKTCQKVWGKESKNWIGKQFEILHLEGKMVVRALNGN